MDHASLIPCTQADLSTLRELSVRTFTEAFAHQNNPEDFQAFYRRHGFTIFDKHAFYVGTDKQTDYMMRRDL